jgi:hypothetical protein
MLLNLSKKAVFEDYFIITIYHNQNVIDQKYRHPKSIFYFSEKNQPKWGMILNFLAIFSFEFLSIQ